MNAIQYALNNLRNTIPEALLKLTFSPRTFAVPQAMWQPSYELQSMDSIIRDRVIEKRVNIDCNLKGGTQIAIELTGVPFDQIDLATRVFRIPYHKTDGRKIINVQSLNYLNYHGIPTNRYNDGNQLLSAAKDLYRSVAQMPIVTSANCQLIGDNTVLVKDDVQHLSSRVALLCIVENEAEMSNLNSGVFPLYADLVELATKAYIYNNVVIAMDQGVLQSGMALGRIREIVDTYADANEQYKTMFKEQWGKASFTNDRPRMNDYIRSMVGRGK